ncbi:hypothetical protein [Leisingera sp. ANG-M7]|uniref:hypothetical protein n=1 Tax=Leisingera sp. ANG-M7 TaxID=1577902 RepID=UPI00057EE3EB|nr:hypothetical protein [Leisingera sp. ANG-M7]KIC39357.1 hypothetical protein RA26_01505 [Leisingera sp. ANG-M7]
MGPNVLGSVARAVGTGNALAQFNRNRRLDDVYQQHGAGIAQGNQNALAALAGVDPMAALQARNTHQAMDLRQQSADRQAQELDMKLEQYARSLSATEAAQKAAELEGALAKGIPLYQSGNLEDLNALITSVGEQPLESLDQFPAFVAPYENLLDKLTKVREFSAPPKPLSSAGKTQADINAGLLPAGTPLTSKGTTVNVNTGDPANQLPIVDKPPKGFQRRWDADRGTFVDEPIPGGDVETERSDAGRKSDLAQAGYQRKSDIVNSNIDKAMQMLDESGRWVAGFGSMLSGVPESGARDFQAVLDTVKANLGFEELQAMRDASPTGGALGAVTEKEIAFLQAIQGNLDAAQSPARLRSVLQEIKDRRAEFAAERERILSKNQTAAQAAELQDRVRGMPNFQTMTDDELDAFIRENER